MRTTSSRTLRFDVYILDLTRCALVRGETEIRLRPKAFDVLRYLVEHAGRLISKEELIGATWQGISVTDDSLVQCIKDIREALSDHDRRIVKTVPRRGYIFAARVEVSSIAVLPFVDLSDSADKTEHLGEGIAEELTNVLARIAGLRVVSRSSSFRFRGKAHDAREIGKLLNVSAVLEGSVRRARRQLRITARLVDVADGCQSWSETYERQVGDLFAIQEEISRVIAERLSLRSRNNPSEPIPKRHTANIEAYHDYLSGRYFWSQFSKSGIAKACRCWECAIEKDPNYALPYAGLADAYFRSYRLGHLDAREASDKINSSARKALALDETLTEAHVSLANIKIHADRDFVGPAASWKEHLHLTQAMPTPITFIRTTGLPEGILRNHISTVCAHSTLILPILPCSPIFAGTITTPVILPPPSRPVAEQLT
jgi:TolB-like protein